MWAFGIARRVLAGQRRGARRRTALVQRLREDLATASAGAADGAVSQIAEALEALDPLDREIIRLVHWDGFSQAEVAQLLDRPAGTVRSRYSRARAQLRTTLDLRHARS